MSLKSWGACPRTCLSGWNCPIRLQLEERGGAGGCTLAVFGSFHYSVLARILFPQLASVSLAHRSLRWPLCSQCPCEVQTARDARNSEMVSVLANAGHIQPEPASGKASVTGVRGPIPLLSPPDSVWSGRRVPRVPSAPAASWPTHLRTWGAGFSLFAAARQPRLSFPEAWEAGFQSTLLQPGCSRGSQ